MRSNKANRRYRLVKKSMTQIQHAHERAVADGISDAVAFVINCEDEVGSRFCGMLDGELVADDPEFDAPAGEWSPEAVLLRCDGFRFEDAKRAAERFFPSMSAFDAPPPPDQILVVLVSEGVETYFIPAAVRAGRVQGDVVVLDPAVGGVGSRELETSGRVSRRKLLPV